MNGIDQDSLYNDAAAEFGPALDRLARAYEFDSEKRRDLVQEIHFSLWRSFASFDERCSLRTWIYRVAHNTATSYVVRQKRVYAALVSLEELDAVAEDRYDSAIDERNASERLVVLIQTLKPLDRQVIVSYLEGMDAASIGEITGLSPPNVAMKIHRIKAVLTRRFHSGVTHAE
ncbi:MAG: sigma-70 family RNA polymerase sigma factor [Bryobacteraceae bacterium]